MKRTKTKIKSLLALALCLCLVLPALSSCGVGEQIVDLFDRRAEADRPVLVSVMLACGEGVTVLGDNPVRVEPGSDVEFRIQVADGRRVILPERADVTVEGDVVTITEVRRPTTVDLDSRPAEKYTFAFSSDVAASLAAGEYVEGTKIKLSAASDRSSKIFIGFSNGATLENGGELLANDANCEITLTRNTSVFANYAVPGSKIIVYHANGGRTSGGSEALFIEVKDSVYICPNALADQGQFLRDGYVLGGYNTAPDGSGRYYGCGWNIVMPENNVAELYAVWIPETSASSFTYTKTTKAVTITKYSGDEETVVIPHKIDGIPVTTIATGDRKSVV